MKRYLASHWLEWCLVIAIALTSLGVYLGLRYSHKEKGDIALVYRGQEKLKEVSLSEESEFEIEGENGYMTIKIHDHGICVSHSSCPGQQCVHQGYVYESGIPIICVHNKVSIIVDNGDLSSIGVG